MAQIASFDVVDAIVYTSIWIRPLTEEIQTGRYSRGGIWVSLYQWRVSTTAVFSQKGLQILYITWYVTRGDISQWPRIAMMIQPTILSTPGTRIYFIIIFVVIIQDYLSVFRKKYELSSRNFPCPVKKAVVHSLRTSCSWWPSIDLTQDLDWKMYWRVSSILELLVIGREYFRCLTRHLDTCSGITVSYCATKVSH